MQSGWILLLLATILRAARGDSLACSSHMKECRNGVCVRGAYFCDGEDDCGDNSDEDTCPKKALSCESSDFPCKDQSRCIPNDWVCDGAFDCTDYSDESSTDGPKCPPRTCAPTSFQCNLTRICLEPKLVCDDQYDCGFNDHSDEEGCEVTCSSTEFKCDDGKCIDGSLKCNRIAECSDKSDEKDCNLLQCSDSKFKCVTSGYCIEQNLKCDGKLNCLDGSDEVNCPTTKMTTTTTAAATTTQPAGPRTTTKAMSTTQKPCMPNHFRCGTTDKCIHKSWVCDGEGDCENDEDESKATCENRVCGPSEFSCKSGECVPSSYKCDRINQCIDSSDEMDCGTPRPIACSSSTFKCGNTSVCILKYLVCNGIKDCPNNEDEPVECGRNECLEQSRVCSHNCTDLDIGYKCSCTKGHHLLADNKTCVNTNECHQHGICSQKCIDLKGSYKCQCHDGYTLDGDRKTCRATGGLAELMVAMTDHIGQFRVDGQHYKVVTGTFSIKSVMSFDVDIREKFAYIGDSVGNSIVRVSLENRTKLEHIVKSVRKPEGIAFDWISRKIFWSSSHPKYNGSIEVANADGSSRSVLIHSKIEEPRAVTVHPIKRLLFWTDWGTPARIERASMDGLGRQVIVSSADVTWPNGLSIDYPSNRIFWSDSKRDYIGSSNLDGSDVVYVVEGMATPHGVAVFEDHVFWTSYGTNMVWRADKFTGSKKFDYKGGIYSPTDIKVTHPLVHQIGTNPCAGNNGGCSHLCLLSAVKSQGFSCACPTDVRLYPDGKHCNIAYPTTTVASTTTGKDLSTTTTVTTSEKVSRNNKTSSSTTIGTTAKVLKSVKPTLTTKQGAVKPGCNDNEFHCISSRMCIPDAKVCDGKNDCPQEEDETLNRCNAAHSVARSGKSKENHTPLIAGIVACIACIILVVVIIALIIYKRRRNQSNLSITFHPGDEELLTVQTVKFNSDGSHKKSANKNFDNINYCPANETAELISDPCLMNVPDDSSSDNGSTCDETKPVMKHQDSSSNNSI